MTEFFNAGGPFMWPIALCGVGVLVLAGKKTTELFGAASLSAAERRRGLALVFQLGMLGFFLGVLAQAVGLVGALKAIQAAADVSPAIIMGGLQVSFYAPILGLVVLVVSLVAWAGLRYRADVLDAE